MNFVNNGSIIGKMSGIGSDDGYGFGIYNTGTIKDIANTGVISGTGSSSSGYGDGYGIYNKSGKIGDITNAGIISGTSKSDGSGSGTGYGIYNDSSTMGKITNTGVISGTGSSSSGSGVGSGIFNKSGKIGDITNAGLISGSGKSSGNNKTSTGFGIYNDYSSEIKDITNTGLISGYGSSSNIGNASGIVNAGKIGNITNIGIIIGTGISDNNGTGSGIFNTIALENITNTGVIIGTGSGTSSDGAGIYNNYSSSGREIENIINTGVIYGTDNAIKNDGSATIDTVNNYGILVNGKDQDVNAGTITKMNNYGLIIKNGSEIVDNDKVKEEIKVEIEEYDDNGNVKSTRKMTIKNKKVTDGSQWFTGNEKDVILNALKDTYKVIGENNNVTGSVINAYGTAVVFGDTGDKELTLSGTIVNGGIDGSAAISGSDDTDNGDTLILQSGKIKYKDTNGVEKYATQNTVVNGNINMGAGADTLTIGDGTIINGILDGGDSDSEDTLNFGISSGAKSNSSESEGVRILHNISNFENMNINTNVTLFEKTIGTDGKETNLEVTGATEIKIGKNGTLTLRIDSTNKKNLSGIDKIIGHALYENTGVISSTDGGKLLLALNGAGNKEIISFGDTKLNTSLVTEYEGVYYEDVTFGTTSLIHSVKRVNGTENEVEITVKKNLPLKALKYEKLNKIYHGILSVEDLIANFNVDSDEKLSTFLGYLNDIYAGNSYSYSSELSRKSVGMFRDIAVESQFKPELNKWLIMGGLTHVDGGTKDTYYGKGYYTYDIGSSDMDADTKITGAYMLGEYGVSDTLTYGVVIGGNKLKSELSNGSKVDGDALYMGAYAKKYVGNLKVT
ncbi:beta strand repeat-containing protein, partial [Fusobacterium varium]|uniref:beta strand repeat-containing protein n=1 Tax=Fusobacterium varium TaxID=856 RepID=UPI003A4D2924